MRLIYDPSVYLLSRQEVVQEGLDKFLEDHQVAWSTDSDKAPEVITETAGRICYMSYDKPRPGGNKAYLAHIKQTGHGSVLEHAVWTFIVTGVSRSLTHELVRHRAGVAYSQLSQRYVDESVAEVVVPPDLADDVRAAEEEMRKWSLLPPDRKATEILNTLAAKPSDMSDETWEGLEWVSSMEVAHAAYVKRVEYLTKKLGDSIREPGPAGRTAIRKAARGAARSVLPNATETKITVTINARSLRHVLEMRAAKPAEVEIRKMAYQMYLIVKAEAPNLFDDYVPEKLADGTTCLDTLYRKV